MNSRCQFVREKVKLLQCVIFLKIFSEGIFPLCSTQEIKITFMNGMLMS